MVTHIYIHRLNLVPQISQSLLRAFKGSCLELESKTSICKCGLEEVAFGRGGQGIWGLISVTKTVLYAHYTIFCDHTEYMAQLSLHIGWELVEYCTETTCYNGHQKHLPQWSSILYPLHGDLGNHVSR